MQPKSTVYLVAAAHSGFVPWESQGQSRERQSKAVMQRLPLSLTRSPAFISSCLDKRVNKAGKTKGGCFQSRSQREWCLPGQKLALGSKRTEPLSPPNESVRAELGVAPGRARFQFREATREGGKEAQTHGTEGLRSQPAAAAW